MQTGEYKMPDGSLYPSGNVSTMRLTGYADLFGVNPGNKIKFYVNSEKKEKTHFPKYPQRPIL